MDTQANHYSVRYGAFELKATYQRNLSIAMASVVSLCLVGVMTGWLLSGTGRAVTVDDPHDNGPTETVVKWNPPPTIERPKPDLAGPATPPPDVTTGWNLNPVEDLPFEEEVRLATREERAIIVEGEPGPDDGGGGVAPIPESEPLPKIDEFRLVEEPAELVHAVKPAYPHMAEEAELEGRVVIKALVSKTGDVLEAVVFVSSGHRLLDEAALAVAGKYKYRPAIQNRRPVAVWVTYNVDFELD